MLESNPFISVIVPTYNRADLILQTLQTLQSQQYGPYEIIVVDDGSADNTEEVVRSIVDARVRYVKKQNGERAAARNFGARLAKGDYVNFFDSDDLALPHHLNEAANMIRKHNNPEWFHLGYAWALPDGTVFRRVDNFRGETLNKQMPNGNPLSCNGVFLRKDVILSLPFNEDRALSASEDYELWVRLAARYPLYFSNNVTSLVVDHEARSVRTISGEKLIKRLQLLVHYLKQDHVVVETFKSDFKKIIADSSSYVALHLANVVKYKLKSLRFLKDAVAAYPGIVSHKRFVATIKNLVIKWQKS